MVDNKLTREFTKEYFLFNHADPSSFTRSQWAWPSLVYVIYRAVVAIHFLVWLVLSGIRSSAEGKWFIYLTNWTFLMLTLSTVVMATTSVHAHVTARKTWAENSNDTQTMPWFLKVQWIIYNIAIDSSLIVTIAYWSILWKPSIPVGEVNFITHAFNSIYIIVDLFITAMPLRLLHFWQGYLYASAYLIFTLAYFGTGGTDSRGNNFAYPILDFYSQPATAVAITCVVLFIAMPLVRLALFGITALRGAVHERVGRTCCHRASYDMSTGTAATGRRTARQGAPSKAAMNDVEKQTGYDVRGKAVHGKNGCSPGVNNVAFEEDRY